MTTELVDVEFFDRLVMEADLRWIPEPNEPPTGFRLAPWRREQIEKHAQVLATSFDGADDARLFRRLGTLEGCRAIMNEIGQHLAFSSAATWLVECEEGPVGCIQGVRRDWKIGAIQNIAVAPDWQGMGIGGALLSACCHGFRKEGLRSVVLEVTADNIAAVRLYHRMGFVPRRRFLCAADVRKTG